MQTEIITTESEKLDEVIVQSGLQVQEAEEVKSNYLPFLLELQQIKDQSGKINFDNPVEIDEKIARELRLKTVKIRTGAGTIKDARKKIHLLKGNLEQAAYNLIKADCELIEEAFTQVEKAREISEKKRKAELKIERLGLLQPFESVVNAQFIDLENMGEDDFSKLLESSKLTLRAKIDAERRAEEERLAAIEEERKRQEEIRIENERLKSEVKEKEKQLAAERAKLEAELKTKKDAEIAEQNRIEAELRAKADAEKKAAKAPRKQKLNTWIDGFVMGAPKGMNDDEAVIEILAKFDGFKKWASDKVNSI